jgi:hypothetical protein
MRIDGCGIEQAYTLIFLAEIFDDGLCAVGGAAIDHDNFFKFLGLCSQSGEAVRNSHRFIEHRQEDSDRLRLRCGVGFDPFES